MLKKQTWFVAICLLFSLFISTTNAQDSSPSAEELISQLQAQNANLQGRLDRVEASRDRLRDQVNDLEAATMTNAEASTTAPEMASSDSSAQLARTQASYDRLRNQMATLQDSNASLEARIDREIASKGRIQAQLATLQESSASFEAMAEDASAEVVALKAQRKDRVRQILNLQRQLAAAPASSANDMSDSSMTESSMSDSSMDLNADMAKIQTERDIAVQRIAELRGQIGALQGDTDAMQASIIEVQTERDSALETIGDLSSQLSEMKSGMDAQSSSAEAMQANLDKIQTERNIAVDRIGELRSDFAAERAVSAAELARAVKLGDRARAQRTVALEKLKALQNMAAPEAEAMSEDAMSEDAMSEDAAPASVETNQANALESLQLYQTLATRIGAGETLSTDEQSQYDSALATLTENQKLVAEQIGGTTYTVVDGDNLSAIAQQVYGDGNSYPKILEANSYLIDDADLIFPGFELVIPQ